MANQEHLDILLQGVYVWNKWRSDNPAVIPNLEKVNIQGAQLGPAINEDAFDDDVIIIGEGYDLRNANFHGATLTNADLSFAILKDANFSEANLTNACLQHADLRSTDFSKANLLNSSITGANLDYANFENADLSHVNFTESDLTGANMRGSKLFFTVFSFGKLNVVDFKGARFAAVHFIGNDLSKCLGLDQIVVYSPCSFDFYTLQTTVGLSKSFLKKMGFPELLVDYLPDFYTPAIRLFPVFLSHSWANKEFARQLYEALIRRGVQIWFDEKKMAPGDEIFESISKGISHCDKMILICSKESLTSWWVDREIDRVLKKERDLFKERKEKIPLLIPITIDDYVFDWSGAKSEEVRRYKIGDFRDWQNEVHFDNTLNELIQALHVDRPNVKPPSYL